MVLTQHRMYYKEIFKIPGFLKGSFLMFGFQDISNDFNDNLEVPFKSFKNLLERRGVEDITVLDYDDRRADIHTDMNFATNTNLLLKLEYQFEVVCDIGCLEHVFNTAQCLENCLSMVKVGGLYMLHTPVNGYFKHGLHTFNPDMLRWVLKENGFEIVYDKFSTKSGKPVTSPLGDTLIWLVGRRNVVKPFFYFPIQQKQKLSKSNKQL